MRQPWRKLLCKHNDISRKARLRVEQLEDRQLLAANALGLPAYDGLLVQYRGDDQVQVVALAPGESPDAALAALRANPDVVHAELNYQLAVERMPNDTSFGSLYGLHNTGQSGGTVDADIDAPEAWDIATGTGRTIVAVIDTGVDYRHRDLYLNIWINQAEIPTTIRQSLLDLDGDGRITFYDLNDTRNQGTGKISDLNGNGRIDGGDLLFSTTAGGWANGIDDGSNGFVDDLIGWDFANNDNNPLDDDSHGTHVAGTIGAIGNNSTGVTGVTWRTQIMALKFLTPSGGTTAAAINALNYAVANGARLSNNSWGGGGYSSALATAISNARAAGHIFVAAAGNGGADGVGDNNDLVANYPSNYSFDNVVAVAATDRNDRLASFSNFGATQVDLGAPGVSILSTTPNDTYSTFSGTSMATPHVSGALALLLDAEPNLTYSQAISRILQNGDAISSLSGKTVTGRRLNINNALRAGTADVSGAYIVSMTPNASGTSAVSSVRVVFNEAIDASTFGLGDIVVMGPTGTPITLTRIDSVGTSGTTFDVVFGSQSAPGTYRVTIGPAIADRSGNLMDQDRDGIKGEATQDQFVGTFSISTSQTQTFSNATAVAINDYRWSVSSITVNQDGRVVDVNVTLNITHTWDSDLVIYLRSSDGTDILLVNRRGGSGDNFTNTRLDDEASVAIASGTAPFNGTFRPEQLLSALDGKNMRGTWQLWVYDGAGGDRGTLNNWSLTITSEALPARRSLDADVNLTTWAEGMDLGKADAAPLGTTSSKDAVGASVALGQNSLVNYLQAVQTRMESVVRAQATQEQVVDQVFRNWGEAMQNLRTLRRAQAPRQELAPLLSDL